MMTKGALKNGVMGQVKAENLASICVSLTTSQTMISILNCSDYKEALTRQSQHMIIS